LICGAQVESGLRRTEADFIERLERVEAFLVEREVEVA
jgi:hypothetical protein